MPGSTEDRRVFLRFTNRRFQALAGEKQTSALFSTSFVAAPPSRHAGRLRPGPRAPLPTRAQPRLRTDKDQRLAPGGGSDRFPHCWRSGQEPGGHPGPRRAPSVLPAEVPAADEMAKAAAASPRRRCVFARKLDERTCTLTHAPVPPTGKRGPGKSLVTARRGRGPPG